MNCDRKILVIQLHSVLVQDSMLTPEYEKNQVKIPESLLNQTVKRNYQLVDWDHMLARRPITLILMMIKSCSYSINDLVFT